MLPEYRSKANLWIGIGLLLQFGSLLVIPEPINTLGDIGWLRHDLDWLRQLRDRQRLFRSPRHIRNRKHLRLSDPDLPSG